MTERDDRSGGPVPLVARARLPDPARPIALVDGRVLTCERRMQDNPQGPPGSLLGGSWWRGPKGLLVAVTLDHTDAWGPLLHASVSYAKVSHLPSWADMTTVKDAVFGDVDCCMLLPKKADYISGVPGRPNSNIFHMWETPERWGIR